MHRVEILTSLLPLLMLEMFSCCSWCYSTRESSIFCVTLLTEMQHTGTMFVRGMCHFLLYLCSSNVPIRAGVVPLNKRVIKSPFFFLFHTWCQCKPYLSCFARAYICCQLFSCAETQSKSPCYQHIMRLHKNSWTHEMGPFLTSEFIVMLKNGKHSNIYCGDMDVQRIKT